MKRCALKRGKSVLKAKGGARFPKQVDRAYRAWIREHPCLLCRYSFGPSEAAHVTSRGAGGKDIGNMVPLCKAHHVSQHIIGIRSFERLNNVNLRAEALRYAELYREACR